MNQRDEGISGWAIVSAVMAVIAVFAVLFVLGNGCRATQEAADVVHEQIGPRATVRKYEWFKDASAQLEAKKANIKALESRQKAMEESYQGKSRSEWPREDREQYNVWSSEVAGVKASFNSLAAEYNAAMSKDNWKFANVGELPAGADKPLPREFKEYTTD